MIRPTVGGQAGEGSRRPMLNESQRDLVVDLVLGRVSESEFIATLGLDPRADPAWLPGLLAEAADLQDANNIEAALTLMFRFDLLDQRHVGVLSDLLIADRHQRHEDIALALQELCNPAAVRALPRAAEMNLSYLEHDENRALSR
jgi:hypothetical protein